MAKVIVTGVVLRLTGRSKSGGDPDGFLILIDDRTTLHIPLRDYGPQAPDVGATVQVRCSVDSVNAALFQAYRRLRDKARPAAQRRWRRDPATGEAEPVRRQRILPVDPDMPQALPDPAAFARRQRALSQGHTSGQPILRQQPLGERQADERMSAESSSDATSLHDLARALWPRWSQAAPPSTSSDDTPT